MDLDEAALLRRVFEAGAAIRSSAEVHAQLTEKAAEAVAQQLALVGRERAALAEERRRLEQERQSLEAMRALLLSEMSDEHGPASAANPASLFSSRSRELQCHAGGEREIIVWGAFFLGYAVTLEQGGPPRLLSSLFIASDAPAYQLFVDGAAVAVRVSAGQDAAHPGFYRVDLVQPVALHGASHWLALSAAAGAAYRLRLAERAAPGCRAVAGSDGRQPTACCAQLLLLFR